MLTVALRGDFKSPDAGYQRSAPEGSELSLVARHRAGDAAAFEELVLTYKDAVYGYLCRCRIPAGTRDDVAQAVFIRIHGALARFVPGEGGSLRSWIFTIVANAVRSHFRHLGVQQRAMNSGLEHDSDFVPSQDPASDDALEGKQMAAWLEQALTRLPLGERQAVMLCCIEGLDQDAAAAVLDIPLNTLKTHLRRGRLSLAESLAKRSATVARENDR